MKAVTTTVAQRRQSMMSKEIVMTVMTTVMTFMTLISLQMTKELKVTVQKVTEKKTSVKDRAKMRQVRRIVVSLGAKMSVNK